MDATEAFIKAEFSAYGDDWKNASIQDVVRLLLKFFNGRAGDGIPHSPKPTKVLGFWLAAFTSFIYVRLRSTFFRAFARIFISR